MICTRKEKGDRGAFKGSVYEINRFKIKAFARHRLDL